MPDLLPFADVLHHLDNFQHTAWRLESRRGYADDTGTEEYRQFIRGETTTEDMSHPYYAARRAQADQGKRFERVRVVDNPPTDGQRFLLHRAQFNIAAGEDIRNLYRSDAEQLGLPDSDFWLIDSRTLITLRFDEADCMMGVEISDDPADVVRACQIRDAAWHHAVPNAEFVRRVRSNA
ncbi:DUF6879 family protein [Streptomyces noursei]|uniref:DUF6879 family protein n=1 Tax=Streptomyces noursei TaxID=1971 RepID=UPI0035D9DF22